MTTTTRPDAVDLTTAAVTAASAVLIAEHHYRNAADADSADVEHDRADTLAAAAVELVDRVHDLAAYVAGLGQ